MISWTGRPKTSKVSPSKTKSSKLNLICFITNLLKLVDLVVVPEVVAMVQLVAGVGDEEVLATAATDLRLIPQWILLFQLWAS